MKLSHAKTLVIAVITLPLLAVAIFNTESVGMVVRVDATADLYKAKCAMCHGPTAAKAFDPAMSNEDLVQNILTGKKGEKPPYMPSYEDKGISEEQALALVVHMKDLRKPADTDPGTATNSNTTVATVDPDLEKTYKTKCAMCHGPTAAKTFDPAKNDNELVQIILKGKKGEKPPYMPGYEEKGMKNDEALGLVGYMKGLRNTTVE